MTAGIRHLRLVAAVLLTFMLAIAGALASAGPAAAAPPSASSTAEITLSPSSGPAGTTVTVTGLRFPKKSTGTVTAGTTTVGVTTTGSGYFTATVTIPSETASTLPVTATVGRTSAAATFTVTGQPDTPPTETAALRFGVTTPGGATANAELDAVAALAGENPSIVMSYYDFGQPAPTAGLDSVAARGADSMLTWEPWRWGGGVTQSAYSNARVAAGDHDAYLREWGTALAAWGGTVYVRYAHEMNGNWYPWAEGVNGNAPGSYAAAWRHVHDVVTSQGATNVKWVWSPNVPYTGSVPLTGLYPGDAYVDVVALDGYNWGTSATWSSWTAPEALFAGGLSELRTIAPGKPIMIAETASAEAGGSKADWNTALVSYLAAQPDIVGFVWFHHDKETDWRIDSSAASATAFAAALAQRRQ
jgi:hypothetical protein